MIDTSFNSQAAIQKPNLICQSIDRCMDDKYTQPRGRGAYISK
jgi:hypothetical protein